MGDRVSFWTWSLRRGDYAASRTVLLLGPVTYGLFALAAPLVDWVRQRPLHWSSTSEASAPAPIPTRAGASVSFDGEVLWTIPDPSTAQRVLAIVLALEVLALIVLGAALLWRLVSGIRSGDPFGGAAVGCVRGIAVLTLIYSVVVKLSVLGIDFAITAPARAEPATFARLVPADLLPFTAGLLLLALAEGFAHGRRMRTDLEGLV